MNNPIRDRLITASWLKAVAVVLGVVWLFWPTGTHQDRARLYQAWAAAITCAAAWRVYRWHWHPFSGASDKWNAAEQDRYRQRQFAQRDRLLQLTPQQFEDAIAQLFHVRHGWRVERTPYSGDGGWDISAYSENGLLLVECKQYRADKPVGRPALQKLHSALITEGARGAVIVTTSCFSEPARRFAAETGIELVDGAALARLMLEAYGHGPKADTVYMMCTRCGAQVEFNAGQSIEAKCIRGHVVTNAAPAWFIGVEKTRKGIVTVPRNGNSPAERLEAKSDNESAPSAWAGSKNHVDSGENLRQWQERMYNK